MSEAAPVRTLPPRSLGRVLAVALLTALLAGVCALPPLVASMALAAERDQHRLDPATPTTAEPAPPAVIVGQGRVQVGAVQLELPLGWRVNTGEAGAPLRLILAAPAVNDAPACALMVVQTSAEAALPMPPGCDPDLLRSEVRTAVGVSITLVAPRADWEAYAPLWARVAESVGTAP